MKGKPRKAPTEEIERLVAAGVQPKEIAARYGVAVQTVYRHLRVYSENVERHVWAKMSAVDYATLLVHATDNGMTPGEAVSEILNTAMSKIRERRCK